MHISYTTNVLLTPWCRVLLEKLTGLQLVKKFPAFHGTRRFITALTSFLQLSLSWASPIQSIYKHPTSWRSILILSTHLRLGFPSGLLPSGFPTKKLYTPLSSPIRATCPAHLIILDFITRTILCKEYKSQLMYTNGKLKDCESSLNFRYMYPIFRYMYPIFRYMYPIFMIHTILFMIHTVQSPQLYILWPEDGPVQRPKHVVSLNKDKQCKIIVFWLERTPI